MKACAEVVLEAISTVVCSTLVPRLLSLIGVGLVANFDGARPSGAGTWTSRLCCHGAFHVVSSAVFQISPIRRVKHERQGISPTRGACEIRWLLGSSAHGNKTRYYVVGIPAASQSLNTGTREASVSDAAGHVRRFEALAVSHSLHGKTVYRDCACTVLT